MNYFNPGSAVSDGNQWNTRVDHQFGKSDNFFARYTDAEQSFEHQRLSHASDNQLQPFHQCRGQRDAHVQPDFLITSRFGLQRLDYGNATARRSYRRVAGWNVDGFPLFHGQAVIPPISIAGYASLSQGLAYYGPQYLISWIADGHKISGSHSIDFGGSIVRTTFKTDNQSGTQVQFNTTQTSNFVAGTGFALASFMLGLPDSAGRVFGTSEGDYYGNAYSIYLQDNWRATAKLTLNLGLRWDYASPMINSIGSGTFIYETGQYVWSKKNPITGAPPNTTPGILEPDHRNIQPRVGIAYQVNNKTVVRSSYGIFFDTFGINYAQTQQGNRGDWPFAFPQTVSGLNATTPSAFLAEPIPGPAQGSTTPLGCLQCLNAWGPTSRTPYVQEWTLSVQQPVGQQREGRSAVFRIPWPEDLFADCRQYGVVPRLGTDRSAAVMAAVSGLREQWL